MTIVKDREGLDCYECRGVGNNAETSGVAANSDAVTEVPLNADRDRLVSLGALSGHIAHEINGCLAALRLHLGVVEVLHTGGATHPPSAAGAVADRSPVEPTVRTTLEGAGACVDRIAELVDEIRRFGRPDPAKPEPIRLDDIARGALRLLGPWVASAVRTEVRLEPTVSVMGHRGRLVQVVVNLLRNAIDALEDSGRPQDARHILITTAATGDHAVLCVQDDGPGIPDDLRAHVFERYFTTKGPERGTGLGLAIARDIVVAHGGELRLEPAPGGGTRAVMRLPVGAPAA